MEKIPLNALDFNIKVASVLFIFFCVLHLVHSVQGKFDVWRCRFSGCGCQALKVV